MLSESYWHPCQGVWAEHLVYLQIFLLAFLPILCLPILSSRPSENLVNGSGRRGEELGSDALGIQAFPSLPRAASDPNSSLWESMGSEPFVEEELEELLEVRRDVLRLRREMLERRREVLRAAMAAQREEVLGALGDLNARLARMVVGGQENVARTTSDDNEARSSSWWLLKRLTLNKSGFLLYNTLHESLKRLFRRLSYGWRGLVSLVKIQWCTSVRFWFRKLRRRALRCTSRSGRFILFPVLTGLGASLGTIILHLYIGFQNGEMEKDPHADLLDLGFVMTLSGSLWMREGMTQLDLLMAGSHVAAFCLDPILNWTESSKIGSTSSSSLLAKFFQESYPLVDNKGSGEFINLPEFISSLDNNNKPGEFISSLDNNPGMSRLLRHTLLLLGLNSVRPRLSFRILPSWAMGIVGGRAILWALRLHVGLGLSVGISTHIGMALLFFFPIDIREALIAL